MVTKQKTQVIRTNSWSTVSKYSMVTKGYCQDDYLKFFIEDHHESPRAPIINRGYYVRFKALEYGWKRVLATNKKNIVISLGCGFDTSAFRYPQNFFIEIDYPSVCQRKAEIIKKNKLIKDIQADTTKNEQNLYLVSPTYVLFAADLRKPLEVIKFFLKKTIIDLIQKSFHDSGMNGINFILFNECSLCYIEQESTDLLLEMLIKVLNDKFSMYQSSITYLGYEMLRSKSCQNNFGKILLNHFKLLGARILTFVNENQIRERFTKLNFYQVDIIDMKLFYRKILNQDPNERERIKLIELFDEWEELDGLCSLYSLIICNTQINKSEDLSYLEHENIPPKLQPLSSYPIISVFGHCSNFDAQQKRIRIFGGFGSEPNESFIVDQKNKISIQSTTHRKFKNILELLLNDSCDKIIKVNVIKSKHIDLSINRVHCRIVQLNQKHFLLSGGRASPTKAMPNLILEIDPKSGQFEVINSFKDSNLATYRHVCSLFGFNSGQLIQFGGINSNELISLFDIESTRWSTKQIRNLQTDRHSMAFSPFGSHSILLNGGLDLNDNFILTNNLELIDHRDPNLKQFSIEQFDQKLYSHQIKIASEYEILVIGGIGDQEISNLFYQIDLRSMKVLKKYYLTCDVNQELMLQNFCCELISSKNLWLIGGGGNCFSFGTHFNPVLLYKLESADFF